MELGKEIFVDGFNGYVVDFVSMEDGDGSVVDQLKILEIGIADGFNNLLWNY